MKRTVVICSLLIAVFGLLTGCSNPSGEDGESGVFTLSVGRAVSGGTGGIWDGATIADLYHTIWLFNSAGAEKLRIDDKKNETITYSVAAGTYEVYVEAWTGTGRSGSLKAVGYALNVAIKSGSNNPIPITMRVPFEFSGGVGLNHSGTVTVGTALTASAPGKDAADTRNINITYQWFKGGAAIHDATGNKYTPQADGVYTVTVSARGYKAVTSAAVTVAGGTTPPTNTFNVSGATQWDAAASAINAAGDGADGAPKTYTINITNSFRITGTTTGIFTPAYIDITINGNGNTISLNGSGSLLYFGGKKTVTMENLNLVGNEGHSAMNLVYINYGDTFTMNSGKISGNTGAGGVYVSGGTFIMNGGEVSGNAGSGVFLTGGGNSTFIMNDGEVSGNTGSGVFVNDTFIMNGGKISGNGGNTVANGSGVVVNGGVFTMTGGEVSGNTAINGGGVYVRPNGTFRVSNGTIYGNNESNTNLQNTATDGGAALYKDDNGTAQRGRFSANGGWSRRGDLTTTDNTIEVVNGELVSGGTPPTPPVSGNGTVTITGKFWSGETLTAHADGFTATNLTYQWKREGEVIGSANTYQYTIPANVTSATYSVTVTGGGESAIGYISVVGGTFDSTNTFNTPLVSSDPNTIHWDDIASKITSGTEENPKRYLINVKSDFTVANPNPLNTTFGGASYIEVIICGDDAAYEPTISLDGTQFGKVLFIGANQTVIMGGLTLKGRAANNDVVVLLEGNNAAFIMNSGKVLGNENNTPGSAGGGVYVNQYGTFTMNGGEVSGNTGGGVNVNNATFTMNGGEVSGNTTTEDYGGGGVRAYGGTFTMTGGKISGNASGAGGGVGVSHGTFIMTGGKVSGNTAYRSGGVEVYVGTFTMTGGEITENIADDGGGGGVLVYHTPFTMTGGTVSGNTALYGGGMYINNSDPYTFRISNGTIYGNNAGTNSNIATRTTVVGGAALYNENNVTAQRGTFAIPGDVNSTWTSKGDLATTDDTIRVVDGELAQ